MKKFWMEIRRGRNYIPIGAMEVYFMGVRLFSKKLCNKWPNNTLVA